MSRWKFETLDGTQTYSFHVNPNSMTSPIPNRSVEWDYAAAPNGDGSGPVGYSGKRAARQPHPWEFGGIIRSQDQFSAFLLWLNKKTWIRLTDHLGRTYVVRLMAFAPEQLGQSRNVHAPHRHTYTMKVITRP